MASFGIYNATGTNLGTVQPASATWSHIQGEDGSGSLTAAGDIAAALLAETTIVRVHNGTRDVFAFVPTTKARRQAERSTEVDLSGPGVKWLLHAGQVLQEDRTDCAEAASTRWLGWMSAAFNDTAWTAPVSHGKFYDGPWVNPRPKDWPDPMAEYIWSTLDPAPAGDVYFRKTFTTAAEQDVIIVAAADDEYRLFLDGTEILSTLGGGPFQWKQAQMRPMRLCAGSHTIAIVGRNLDRPGASTNFGWVMATVYPANSSGEPESANQLYKVYTDHSSGGFTLTASYETTGTFDITTVSAADIEAALEALPSIGAGNVTVTGSGTTASPWEITFDGDLASTWVLMTGTNVSLTGGTGFHVDEWVRGSYAEAIVHTDTSWKMLAYPATAPGMTPGHILRVLIEEARARGVGVLDNFTLDFSDALDSAGTAWSSSLSFPVSLPADVHRVAVMLEEMGFACDVTPALALQCWNDRGGDLSAAIVLTAGTANVTNVNAQRDETAVSNVIHYRTGEGWTENIKVTSIATRGRWEAGINLDGFTSAVEADPVVQALVIDLADPPRTTSLEIPSEATYVPYADFNLADIISAPAFGTGGYEATDMRVVSIAGRLEERSIVWSLELTD